jgi:hypothetical protein
MRRLCTYYLCKLENDDTDEVIDTSCGMHSETASEQRADSHDRVQVFSRRARTLQPMTRCIASEVSEVYELCVVGW